MDARGAWRRRWGRGTRHHPRAVLTCLAMLVSAPATADAATVQLGAPQDGETCARYGLCNFPLEFNAAAGEANVVSITPTTTEGLVVRDDGAPLQAGSGCERIDEHSAECGLGRPIQGGTVELGDRDDHAVSPGVLVSGGDGNDFLEAPGGAAKGGAGNDSISCELAPGPPPAGPTGCNIDGESGADRVAGGPASDRIVGGAGDNDVLEGGEGLDVIDYSTQQRAVRVDLSRATQRSTTNGGAESIRGFEFAYGGEGDDFLTSGSRIDSSFDASSRPFVPEMRGGKGDDRIVLRSRIFASAGAGDDVVSGGSGSGGTGDDRLTGSRGRDGLSGGPGRDVLRGSGGGDELQGGSGADQLDGGGGEDVLTGGPGADRLVSVESRPRRDRVDCGAGRGDRAVADRRDRIRRCERVKRQRRRT
ncbi:MAG: calcium-binding protein [Solirubrobacteraceae bacterium]